MLNCSDPIASSHCHHGAVWDWEKYTHQHAAGAHTNVRRSCFSRPNTNNGDSVSPIQGSRICVTVTPWSGTWLEHIKHLFGAHTVQKSYPSSHTSIKVFYDLPGCGTADVGECGHGYASKFDLDTFDAFILVTQVQMYSHL